MSMQYATKNEIVYSKMREAILEGSLNPGERLVVAELARVYDVSPMPVREAIARLGQEGLVEVNPHIGARVTSVDRKELMEITAIRTELETLAARLATPLLSEADISQMQKYCLYMRESLLEGDTTRYESLNREFHELVYRNCGNETLLSLINTLWTKSEITRTVFRRFPARNAQSLAEHEEWLAAVKERDPDRVAAIVRQHKEEAFKRLSAALEKE